MWQADAVEAAIILEPKSFNSGENIKDRVRDNIASHIQGYRRFRILSQ